jgi:hypothetical protein
MEDMTETIVAVLDNCLNRDVSGVDSNFTCADLTPNEFQEVLVGMKMQFDSMFLKHYWVCDQCQEGLSDKDQKPSEQDIDLSTIEYLSIEHTDKEIMDKILDQLRGMADDDYDKFIESKYPDPDWRPTTREEEASRFSIKEPINIFDNGKLCKFEFMRMRHIIQAYRTIDKIYSTQIRIAQSNPHKGMDVHSRNATRKQEVAQLEQKKGKDILLCVQAYTLKEVDGEPIKSNDEKLRIYKSLSRSSMLKLMSAFDMAKYGVHYEFDSKCNLCGHEARRWLQREISILELLPFPDSDRISSHKKSQKSTGIDFFFG